MSEFKFSRRALLKGAALSAGALSLPSVSYGKPYLITGKAHSLDESKLKKFFGFYLLLVSAGMFFKANLTVAEI